MVICFPLSSCQRTGGSLSPPGTGADLSQGQCSPLCEQSQWATAHPTAGAGATTSAQRVSEPHGICGTKSFLELAKLSPQDLTPCLSSRVNDLEQVPWTVKRQRPAREEKSSCSQVDSWHTPGSPQFVLSWGPLWTPNWNKIHMNVINKKSIQFFTCKEKDLE